MIKLPTFSHFLYACVLIILLPGCIKDKVTRTYTIMRPVYATKAGVLLNIKAGPAEELKTPGKIYIRGNYIFINEVNKGVHVIDNSDPSSPQKKAFISIPGNVDIAVVGHYLYADMYNDLLTINIEDPLNVSVVDTVENVFPQRMYENGWVESQPSMIIVDWITKDTTVVVDGNSSWWQCAACDFIAVPEFANVASGGKTSGPVPGVAGSMARIVNVGDFLYGVNQSSLIVLNIDNPADPLRRPDVQIGMGWNIETIYPFNNNLFITFSIFLIFYIKDELSYDKYHVKSERIFRINSYIQEPDKPMMNWAITQYPLGPTLKQDYQEVEQFTRFVPNGRTLYKYGDIKFYEDKIFFADSGIFKIFTHRFIDGNPNTALVAPNAIVLTKSIAEKYFGKATNAVGKSLENDNKQLFRVTAVIDDVPQYSHIRFNILVSVSTLPADFGNNWGNFSFFSYVLLRPNVNAAAFEKKLGVMYDKYMASIFSQFNVKIHYGIQKITGIHLHSNMANEPEELGSMSYIYIFSAVVLFMLLIACINYMNLTTARSARRAKEIGVRKVTGSSKWQLVAQFLVESSLTTVIALILSIILAILFLPLFNQVSGKQIAYDSIFQPGTFLILLGIIIFVGLVGGSYPAFYLSRMQPVTVLKGTLSKSSGNVVLRRILVVVQFTISMIMLICTWVVDRQLHYLRTRDLGFNKEQVLLLAVNANRDMRSNITAFKNEVRKNPRVKSVSSAGTTPGGNGVNFNLFTVETSNGFIDQGVDCYAVDENYLNTLGIKVLKGRNFSGLPDTLRSVVVNENMTKYFKWNEPLGKKIKFPGDTSGYYLEVVGVFKDFNQKSLYNPITPLILFYTPNANNILVKLDGQSIKGTIADIGKKWNATFPDLAFSYTFLDEDFNAQYAADQRRGKIYAAFSMLTIFITCLGLLGLIAFTTQQRQKEISIRKVLGAGIAQLVPLITKNFVILVGISCLLAFPIAYIFMTQWLKIFPYNTGISVLPFIFSAIVVLFITMLTVVFHTIKAAIANPAQTLKTE